MNRQLPNQLLSALNEIGMTTQQATWDCHGTPVVLHKALEQIAAHKGMQFDAPTIIDRDTANKTVVICVTGRLGDKSEWSIGEAAPYNNKNSYPYAMAEKRAKDRVILKLLDVAGFVYSEEEADDFKQARPQQQQPQQQPQQANPWLEWAAASEQYVAQLTTQAALMAWSGDNDQNIKSLAAADQAAHARLEQAWTARMETLQNG